MFRYKECFRSGYTKAALSTLLLLPILNYLIPSASSASVEITPSSTHWYGPGLLRILITDTSRNAPGSSISTHIDVKRGSTILASADPVITTPGTAGTFELYLTTSNAPFAPAFPSNPNNYAVGRINSQPQIQLRDFGLSLAAGDYLRDGDSVVIAYSGLSQTIEFAKSNVIASVDRTVAGDGNRITITLTDQNANLDPTAIDNFAADPSIISVNANGATMNFSGARFIEEGQNSAAFDLVITATSASGDVINPPNGATLKNVQFPTSAQFTLHGFEVYPNIPNGAVLPYNTVTPNSQVSSSQTVTLTNSDGVVTLGNNPQSPPGNNTLSSSGVALQLKALPTVVRANSSFWIDATVTNNSTSTVQFSQICSPFFSVDFQPSIVSFAGHPCNIMAALEMLKPGQSVNVRIPGFDDQSFKANQTGVLNATVTFNYQVADRPGVTGNISRSISIPIYEEFVPLGRSFLLGYNQTVTTSDKGLALRFVSLTEDSRCPSDVQCVWAGRATVQVDLLTLPGNHSIGRFNLTEPAGAGGNSSVLAGRYKVSLAKVEPYPNSKSETHASDYVITLVVSKADMTQALGASWPRITQPNQGSPVLPKADNAVMLSSNVTSALATNQTFVAVFEVRSLADGVTEYLGFANGTAMPNKTVVISPTSPWIPKAGGNYQIRVFIIDRLDMPVGLSSLTISEVKVQ